MVLRSAAAGPREARHLGTEPETDGTSSGRATSDPQATGSLALAKRHLSRLSLLTWNRRRREQSVTGVPCRLGLKMFCHPCGDCAHPSTTHTRCAACSTCAPHTRTYREHTCTNTHTRAMQHAARSHHTHIYYEHTCTNAHTRAMQHMACVHHTRLHHAHTHTPHTYIYHAYTCAHNMFVPPTHIHTHTHTHTVQPTAHVCTTYDLDEAVI